MLDWTHRVLSHEERLDWMRLIQTEGIGPRHFFALLSMFKTVETALRELPELDKRNSKKYRKAPLHIPSRDEISAQYEKLVAMNGTAIAGCEPAYPPLLRQIYDAPPVLYVLGQASLLRYDSIAIVGARRASINGCNMAESLAREIGSNGITIISGLARGIDTAAHRGSLHTGTMAVVAGGPDRIYPPENAGLYRAIIESGAIISEQPIGVVPRAELFPRRNRLISGISHGTVVVEAHLESGSLITARLALEQGRDVFAVPGSPRDPRARGPNQLIKDGAYVVEEVSDVLSNLQPLHHTRCLSASMLFDSPQREFDSISLPASSEEIATARTMILEALDAAPLLVDDLLLHTNLPSPVALAALLELELSQKIERQPGNRVSLLYAEA